MQLKLDRDIVIPDQYRDRFSGLPDVLITKESQIQFFSSRMLVTIGDVVTATALKYHIVPKLSVVDFKTKREVDLPPLPEKWDRQVRIKNSAGTISSELWDSVGVALSAKGNTLLTVEGEEDLASIPAICLAPDGAIVIYGVPDKGIAVYEVGECLRKLVYDQVEELRGVQNEHTDNA